MTLGILSLIGIVPTVPVPIAVIAFAATMILGSIMLYRMNEYLIAHSGATEEERRVADRAARGTSSTNLSVGIGPVVLGIPSIVSATPVILALVALIGGAAVNAMAGGEVAKRSSVTLAHA